LIREDFSKKLPHTDVRDEIASVTNP
jgi:hypothetical protein